MSNVKKAAAHLRLWPDTYRMGEHDRNLCKVAADTLDEVEQLRVDNAALLACVQTAIKYGRIENPTDALQFLVRKLRRNKK